MQILPPAVKISQPSHPLPYQHKLSLNSPPPPPPPLRLIFLNSSNNSPLIRAHYFPDLLPALEDQKRRHRPDTQFLCDIGHFVDVELVEFDGRVLFGHFDYFGGDDFAGTAPLVGVSICCTRGGERQG